MKKFIIFFAALAAVLSCSKENPSNYNPVDGTYSVTLTASAPGADTKTTLVDGGVDADGKPIRFVHWSKGDAIKVLLFPNRSNGNTVTGPNGVFTSHFDTESSDKAYFRTDSWSWADVPHDLYNDQRKNRLASTGIAVYPSTATAFSNKTTSSTSAPLSSEISFVLPEEQNAVVGNIESGLNFSYADVNRDSFINTVDKGSKTELQFKNACALIQLTMPAEMPKVTEISIISNDKVALTGKGDMNYTTGYNDNVDGTITVTNGENVVLKCSDGFKVGATYYAVVWPGAHNSGLTIEFAAEDGTVATKTTPSVTLTASMVKPYTFNKGLEFIAPVQEFDYIYADGTTGNDIKSNVVGVIIFHGNPKDKFNNSEMGDKFKGLAISLKDYVIYWGTSSDTAPNWKYPSSVGLVKGTVANYNIGGFNTRNVWLTSGYNNLDIYKTNYGTLPEGVSLWYLPAPIEWKYIAENLSKINSKLSAVGGQVINLGTSMADGYWLPLAEANSYDAYVVHGPENSLYFEDNDWTYKYSTHKVRPIFAF